MREFRETEAGAEPKTGTKPKICPEEVLGIASKTIAYKTLNRDPSLGESSGLLYPLHAFLFVL